MSNNGWSSIWIFTLLFYAVSSLSPSAKQGFNDKFMSTRQQLTNTIYQNSRDQNNLKINTSMLWSRSLEMQRNSIIPLIIRTNHHTIMLKNMDLWVFKDEDFHYSISLRRNVDYDVQFVKGFEWQDRLFLLVCFQNSVCSLYSTSYTDVTYHQLISDNEDPIDAQFFVQQGKLYLTILFHERSFSVRFNRTNSRLRIYQWHNMYMDPELIPDITFTATCITLFGYKEDIVLVLGCPGDESLKFRSQVWSRKPNGEMIQVQYLPTDRSISINHFMERGENFIIIMEKDRETSIYWWEGSEFVPWLSVDGVEKYFQVTVSSNLKYTTFLTFTYSNVLRIYLMTSVKLDQVYETEFSSGDMKEKLSILRVAVFEENGITYMLVLTKSESQVYISLHKINIQILDTIATEVPNYEGYRSDTAQEALDTVYRAVTSLKNKMKIIDDLSSLVLLTNKDATIRHGVVTGEIFMDGGEVRELLHTQRDMAQFIDDLYAYISPITQEIKLTRQKLQTTPLYENRSLSLHGNVIVKEAKINSLTAQIVNNDIFEPRSFLSVTKSHQRLKSIKAKKLRVDWLAIPKIGDKKTEDFHLAESRVNVPISVVGLESRNLWISEKMSINNVTAKDLTNKMVTVETEEDAFNKISQIGAGKPARRPEILKLQDNTVIQNLNVDFIDDVSVTPTLTSVFISGGNNVISGDIHFKAGVRTNQITARRYNFPVRQNVQYPSQINILPGQMYMYPPLKPQVPLYSPYPPPLQQYPQHWAPFNPLILDGRRMKWDIFGDTERTIRKKKVKIIGHLKVERLLFRNSSLVVNNHSVPTSDLGKTFWTRTTPQKINGSVHFSQGISIGGSLKSPIVNGKNLTRYASRTSNFNSLILENIHVDGNMTTEKIASLWMPENELQDSVFKVLNVKHLKAEKINGENTKNILQTSDLNSEGIKIITENLKVDGDLEADLINDKDVRQKLKSAVMTDGRFKLNEVEFETISGDNIEVNNLNNHSFESLMGFSSRENSSIFIRGNIHLSQLSKVTSINNYPANFSKVVNKKKGATIYGKKKFHAQVVISKELKITNINNVNLGNWLTNLLRVSGEQEVLGFYTIRNAEMSVGKLRYKCGLDDGIGSVVLESLKTNKLAKSEFNVSSINGIRLSSFVYTNQPQVMLLSNIRFKTIAVDGNVTSASLHRSCQLPKVEDEIAFEQSSKWSILNIVGDSDWPKARGGRLQHLFESAVTSYGDQTITGNVTIQLLSVPNIRIQSLNDKNITFFFQDSLSRRKKNQVILGKKTFLRSFKCKNIEVKGDAQIKSINNININDVDERLVRRSGDGKEIVSGHKTFLNGFKAFSLECPEGINGVKAENIVSRTFSGEAPPFTVRSLKVYDSLFVETIDGLNLKDFLKDCIYLNHTDNQRILGQLHIKGNVSLQGNVTAPSINKISTNDVVFVSNKKKPVKINGCKRFSSDIKIESDLNIHVLNDRDLSKTYRDNVKVDQNVTINGSVVIESEVEVDTIFAHEYFVGPKQLIYLNKTFTP